MRSKSDFITQGILEMLPTSNNELPLASLLATGLLRWHQQRLISGISDNSDLRRLEVSRETVLSVITPVNGAGDSETREH